MIWISLWHHCSYIVMSSEHHHDITGMLIDSWNFILTLLEYFWSNTVMNWSHHCYCKMLSIEVSCVIGIFLWHHWSNIMPTLEYYCDILWCYWKFLVTSLEYYPDVIGILSNINRALYWKTLEYFVTSLKYLSHHCYCTINFF
jgi:hypothetical protein